MLNLLAVVSSTLLFTFKRVKSQQRHFLKLIHQKRNVDEKTTKITFLDSKDT